jgi:glucosylceramidase
MSWRRTPIVAVVRGKLVAAGAVFGLLAGLTTLAGLMLPGVAAARAHAPAVSYGPRVKVVQTSGDLTEAMAAMPPLRFSSRRVPHAPVITVHGAIRYQRFRGAGGALTDSSAWLIGTQIRPGTRAWLLRHLFGPSGINLNLIRVPIGASDFTVGRAFYSYDDMPAGQTDPTLSHFSIAHDEAYTIPVLKQILGLAERPFTMASLWSPPGWMKSNDSMANIANTATLLPVDVGPLSQYFVHFLQAYQQAGVRVDAITPQNEPGQQSIYPGLNETEPEEAAFVAQNLAPALGAAHLRTRIFGFDSNWSGEAQWAGELLHGPAGPDLSGFASHCYFGSPTAMATVRRMNPALEEIASECAPSALSFPVPELEIGSLRNWATGVELWNLALDPRGGPVQAPNWGCRGCRGIVSINPAGGNVSFTRNYYELGQLTKFVAPGAVRIASNTFVAYTYPWLGVDFATPGLDDVAFRNPNGTEVLLAYNSSSEPITFSVAQGRGAFTTSLDPTAMSTFIWRPSR